MKKTKLLKLLGSASMSIYDELGALNFDERDFQIALGYELNLKGVEYLRETHIELFYKDIPIKLGAPDFFLNKEKPSSIIELKHGSSIANSNRQQLKMYLLSIKKNPRSVLKNVKNGILINFLKENPLTYEKEEVKRKKDIYKVEIEIFTLDGKNNLKLLEIDYLGKI
jgi:GxxExxY protein